MSENTDRSILKKRGRIEEHTGSRKLMDEILEIARKGHHCDYAKSVGCEVEMFMSH